MKQQTLKMLMQGIYQYLVTAEKNNQTSCTIEVDAVIVQTAYTEEEFSNDKLTQDIISNKDMYKLLQRMNIDAIDSTISVDSLVLMFSNSKLCGNYCIKALITEKDIDESDILTCEKNGDLINELLYDNQDINEDLINQLAQSNHTKSNNIVDNIMNNISNKFNK